SVELEEPRLFYIRSVNSDVRFNLSVMVGPKENIQISGSRTQPQLSGSTHHELYVERFVKPRAALDAAHGAIQAKYRSILSQSSAARNAKDAEALERIEKSAEWKNYEADIQ